MSADVMIRALRRAMVLLLITALVRSVPFMEANAGVYTPAALEWAAYGLLVVVTLALAVLTTRGRTPQGWRGVLTATVLIASVLATAAVPVDRLFTSAHWSWYVLGWFLVAVHLEGRFALLSWVLVLHLAVVAGQGLMAGPLDRQDVAEFLVRGVVFTGVQLAFGAAALLVGRIDRASSRIRDREAKALTGRRIADELLRQRRERHAAVSTTAVPLLEGLADGTLAADDPAVRRRSMVEATRLRRLMAESDLAPNPLNHELRACVDVAERAGLEVDVAFRGSTPSPDLAVRRELTEPVIAVLAGATGSARVTVVGTHRDVVISVLAEVAADDGASPEKIASGTPGGDVAVTVIRSPGRIWVTSRWESRMIPADVLSSAEAP